LELANQHNTIDHEQQSSLLRRVVETPSPIALCRLCLIVETPSLVALRRLSRLGRLVLCNNPRDGWIFTFVSMTELQLHEVRGRNKGCADANRKTIGGRGLHETQLENEIADMSDAVDELTERHLDVQNQLLEATANLCSSKKSKEKAVAAIDKARSKNKMLDLQVELAGKILFPTSDQPKPFGGTCVTLKAVREVMLLHSFLDVADLNAHQTHLCIRILNNFGLLKILTFGCCGKRTLLKSSASGKAFTASSHAFKQGRSMRMP
jgi:hypothetical protein